MLRGCNRCLILLQGDLGKIVPLLVRGFSVAQADHFKQTAPDLHAYGRGGGHRKRTNLLKPYHDAFPSSRGGATTREHMLDNVRLQAKVDEIQTYLGIKPAEKQLVVFESKHPRHLELLGFNKPQGFSSLKNSRSFFNKLNLVKNSEGTTAWVENFSGDIVCSASTSEWGIAKQLYSLNDVMAAVNIARVLAQRCGQVGIGRVYWNHERGIGKPLAGNAESIREFEGMMYRGGVILKEAPLRRLKGPPPQLPPAKQKRQMRGKMTKGEKNRYTYLRKDKPRTIYQFVPGESDRAPWYARDKIDHEYPEL